MIEGIGRGGGKGAGAEGVWVEVLGGALLVEEGWYAVALGKQAEGDGERRVKEKVSLLSISALSESYLCQTPTILSSDTETASRTSGRRGKHSRTPREV
ncbi:hypothetical protein NQZ68_003765 [Dissostichus eleginoides]|nr:hypothetical protein NQZ68_003765 [Dissostichus eleginoides]